MAVEHSISNSFVPFTFYYTYRVGEPMEKYLQGLAKKKLLGVKCPDCGRVIVPPRQVCGRCNARMEEWVELKPEGKLENFTVASVRIENGEFVDAPEPYVIGLVKLDEADSLMMGLIQGLKPDQVKTGIRLRAVFKDQSEGTVQDLSHFEPIR